MKVHRLWSIPSTNGLTTTTPSTDTRLPACGLFHVGLDQRTLVYGFRNIFPTSFFQGEDRQPQRHQSTLLCTIYLQTKSMEPPTPERTICPSLAMLWYFPCYAFFANAKITCEEEKRNVELL